MPRVHCGAFFFVAPGTLRAGIIFIILVDRMFTSFIEGAFTSIFDASAEIAAISCLYHRRHAD